MPSPENPLSQTPALLIIMGVAGSGKSTVAKALAKHYDYRYLDADDFHSDEAKALMAAGTPLTDELRAPWVHTICAYLTDCASQGISCTLAFSGLRQAHRETLRQLPFRVAFVYLKGSKATILKRMQGRKNHFMPTSLLDSQFTSMEDSATEPDVISINIAPPLNRVLINCKKRVDDWQSSA